MAGSVNKVILIGNLGQDPDIRTFPSGGRICNLSIATSQVWKDKQTGERKERTEWHRVALLSDGLIKLAEQYLKKGDKVYIEGMLETRSWEKDGHKHYTTEIVLRPYKGILNMLSSKNAGSSGYNSDSYGNAQQSQYDPNAPANYAMDEQFEEIPF